MPADASFFFAFRLCLSSSNALRFLSSFNFSFFACNFPFLSLLLAPPPPALSDNISKSLEWTSARHGRQQVSRQFNIDLPRGRQAIVKVGVVIELQTRLQTVVAIKFEERKPLGLASFFLRPMAYRARLYLCKVLTYGIRCGGEGKIAWLRSACSKGFEATPYL